MTMQQLDIISDQLTAALPNVVVKSADFRGERTLFVESEKLVEAMDFLKNELAFNFLSDIVADDYLEEYPRFYVSYHLYSISQKLRLRVRVPVEDPDEGPPTLEPLWHIATWLEMEVFDLFGIRFANNKGLRRLFLPQDWQGYPLRKDYPLGYEEVQFSFNYEEIDAKKPYAKD